METEELDRANSKSIVWKAFLELDESVLLTYFVLLLYFFVLAVGSSFVMQVMLDVYWVADVVMTCGAANRDSHEVSEARWGEWAFLLTSSHYYLT